MDEKIKHLFETLTPVARAFTATATLILAILTFHLQQVQNDLQNREFLPQFIVESTLSSSTPTVEVIQIYHSGGGFSAFSAMTFSEYEVTLPTKFENAGHPIILPVNDYFVDSFYKPYTDLRQSQSNGLIDTITSTTTAYEKVLAVQQNYSVDTSPAKYKSISFKSYLVIAYNDIFGKRHVEYYFVFPNFSYKIPEVKGKVVISRHYELSESSVSAFDSLDRIVQTAEEQKTPNLIQRILKKIEQGKNEYDMNQFYLRTTGCALENLMECDPSGPG